MVSRGLFERSENVVQFEAGTTIFEEGQPGHVMYVILDGEVEILVGDQRLAAIGPGEVFGEMALVDLEARSASAIAMTNCRLAVDGVLERISGHNVCSLAGLGARQDDTWKHQGPTSPSTAVTR
jgi:signal-transduction protein with cAMP-binding, CBS, and nucleotidyltransferase domain